MPTTQTQYICGRNNRSESRSCNGRASTTTPGSTEYEYGPLRVQILNRDLGYRFELEPATRVYTAFRVNPYGSPIWIKPQRTEPAKRSGKTVHTRIETTDTGERQEMFGYTARRVMTRTTQTRDSQRLSESECDGWYVDPPAAWRLVHPPPKPGIFHHAVVFSGTGEQDDYTFAEVGERETGFVLLARRTQRSSFQDQAGYSKVHESLHREEITEFSEAPIGPDRFVPTGDFKRVTQLSEEAGYSRTYRIRLRWEMLKDSIILAKKIARFLVVEPSYY